MELGNGRKKIDSVLDYLQKTLLIEAEQLNPQFQE
jgi:hypothetical protein